MYQHKERTKNLFIMLIDLVSLLISFFSVDYISNHIVNRKYYMSYDVVFDLMGTILLAFFLVFFFFNMNQYFMKRSWIEELFYIIKMNILLALVLTLVLFIGKHTEMMTRGALGIALVVNVLLMSLSHNAYKSIIIYWNNRKKSSLHVYLITTFDRVAAIVDNLKDNNDWGRKITGISIIDKSMQGSFIEGIPVVSSYEDMFEFARREIVDEVYINVSYASGKSLKPYILEFEKMGITVHMNINMLEGFEGFDKEIGIYGPYPVISFASKMFDANKMLIKRLIDIVGAVAGLALTMVVGIFVAPAILIESRGPLLFKQKRVGKNGRYFYMYKFRSMYRDAEARKAALMEQNQMKGLMFKMDNDPRITKVGNFIRKTSIDELPQFWNVLKGDMSLVGTRPPTVDEFKQYAGYHKRRLSIKPGITGLWQVSGRSNIEDFEEVVKLDLEYIDTWSLTLDIKILLKTVGVVFMKKGSK